jgi:hypothetical protein
MYRGYRVDLDDLEINDDIDITNYISIGARIHRENKAQVEKKLDSFKDSNGNLVASQITADWFPPIKADVFLSHSHKDEATVLWLSGLLFDHFGIRSFVDSSIWGHSDHLLRLLDNEYCYRESTGTYSYRMRNRSTSHVHMMVSIALMKMIDSCECIMFVDTPNSISPKEYITDADETKSPWIYSEISMTSLVRRRSLSQHRRMVGKIARTMDAALAEYFQVEYDVDLSHLIPLTSAKFAEWMNCNKKGTEALDALYRLDSRQSELH